MYYQCKSQVQHLLSFGLTSYAICLCPQTYSITGTLSLSLVPLCATVLTRALLLPWSSMQFLGGILLLSTNLFILLFYDYLYIETQLIIVYGSCSLQLCWTYYSYSFFFLVYFLVAAAFTHIRSCLVKTDMCSFSEYMSLIFLVFMFYAIAITVHTFTHQDMVNTLKLLWI